MADLDFSDQAVKPALDFSDQAVGAKPAGGGFWSDVGRTMSGAVDKLKADANTWVQGERQGIGQPPPDLVTGTIQSVRQTGRMAGLIGDAAGVVASPIAGLIHAGVVKPGADLLDKIPAPVYVGGPELLKPSTWQNTPHLANSAEKHAANEGMITTALSAAGPEAAPAAGLITKAPKFNAAADMVTRFDQAGVSPMLAAAGGKGSSTLANFVAENPLAGGLVRSRLQTAVAQTGDAATALAQKYGSVRGPQITGENLQAGVTRFARDRRDPGSFAAKAGANYDSVFNDLDAAMAGKTDVGSSQIATPATSKVLNDISNSTQSAALGQLVADPTVGRVAQALTDANSAQDMSFGDLRRVRTWVRDAQKDPELRQKIGPANLQRLEGALTSDIYSNAANLGSPELAGRLRRADQYYAAGQARIQDALQSFADAGSGESAYNRITQAAGSTASADAAKLLALKRSLAPDEWGDVAANVVSSMGRPTPGQAGVGEPGFSVSTFVTRYNQLSPRGKDILFGATGGGGAKATALRSELDNLASVANDLKGIEKGANTSKTFVNAQAAGSVVGLLTPATTIPTAAGLGSMALTGEVLTNPLAVRWLAKLGQAQKTGPLATSAALRRLQAAARVNAALMPVYIEAAKRFAPEAGDPTGEPLPARSQPNG